MNVVAVGLIAAFAVFAIADWRAAWRDDRQQRSLTKPAATVMLVAVAALGGQMAGDARAALIVASVLCLAGDVALLGDSDAHFLSGLGAFAIGHAAYVVTALLVGIDAGRMTVAIGFIVLLLVFQTATKMLPGARRHGGNAMLVAVAGYSVIISAMVITATGTPSWVAMVGAKLFAVSDTMIGYNRFVKPIRRADVPIMVTYHVGQLLLILGLTAGG